MIKVQVTFEATHRQLEDKVVMYFDNYVAMMQFVNRLNKISTQPFTYQWTDNWKGKIL